MGTSGWQYRHWRDRFYAGIPQRLWLEHYASGFATVEVNNAFYRLPDRSTFEKWRERTPDDFVYAVKVSRYLSHVKRLRDAEEPVARFMERATGLGDKLGPVLLQLPPSLRANAVDVEALDTVLRLFGKQRVAVEPRHDSWWVPAVRSTLERHGAALCWADRRGRPVTPTWRTAGFGYVRLHEGRAEPRPRYGRQALSSWLDRMSATYDESDDVYVYFNNDPGGAAVHDAVAFARLAGNRGMQVSRSPESELSDMSV